MNQNNAGFLNAIPVVTRNIIIINILFALAQFLLGKNGIDLAQYLGLYFFKSELFMPHQFLTSIFMHSAMGPMHLVFNMFALFMFGRTLEMVWGAKKFLFFYIACGLGAAIAQEIVWTLEIPKIFSEYNITNPLEMKHLYNEFRVVGASGSVFGILVGFGMLFPDARLMIIPIPVPVKAKWVVIGYGIMELGLGTANLKGDSIAHFAHLGGLITGFLIVYYWKKKGQANGTFHS